MRPQRRALKVLTLTSIRSVLFFLFCLLFYDHPSCLGDFSANEEAIVSGFRSLFEKKYSDKTTEALEHFRRGYWAYQADDFTQAIRELKHPTLNENTALGDYAYFFLAASYQRIGSLKESKEMLERLISLYSDSSLLDTAKIQLAFCEKELGNPQNALSFLQPFLKNNPPAMLLAAECYERLNDPVSARKIYEKIYYEFPTSAEADLVETRVPSIRGELSQEKILERANALIRGWQYRKALGELDTLTTQAASQLKDAVHLKRGMCYYHLHEYKRAVQALKRVRASNAKLHPEALFYIFQSQRRLRLTSSMSLTAKQLRALYPKHNVTESAFYLLAVYYERDEPEKAMPLYNYLATAFPSGAYAEKVHWKIVWQTQLRRRYAETAKALERYIKKFPASQNNHAALFWLARAYEKLQRTQQAYTIYAGLAESSPNTFYGLLAKKCLREMADGSAPEENPETKKLFAPMKPKEPPAKLNPNRIKIHLERFRQISLIGFEKLAFRELEVLNGSDATKVDLLKPEPPNGLTAHPLHRIRVLKKLLPNYYDYPDDSLPQEIWKLFFPLEYWDGIKAEAEKYHLNPYLVSALIRQESAFDRYATSSAHAMGLMQVMPGTGKLIARGLDYPGFRSIHLYDPEVNVRFGTYHFARLVKKYDGKIELALAAYNAGESRLESWLKRYPTEDLYEFVESIPFTETREYVKVIVTSINHYKRIYADSK